MNTFSCITVSFRAERDINQYTKLLLLMGKIKFAGVINLSHSPGN